MVCASCRPRAKSAAQATRSSDSATCDHDERLAHPARAADAAAVPAAVLQRGRDVGPRRSQRGNEAERQRGGKDGRAQPETRAPRTRPPRSNAIGTGVSGQESVQASPAVQIASRSRRPAAAASSTLSTRNWRTDGPTRADCQPHGDFTLAAGRAREQQTRQIRARDQEDDADDRHEQCHHRQHQSGWRRRATAEAALTPRPLLSSGYSVASRAAHDVERRLRLARRSAGRQPAEHLEERRFRARADAVAADARPAAS